MGKKKLTTNKEMPNERKEILELCYARVRELIPECSNEVTLIKCIEILEKRESGGEVKEDEQNKIRAIAATLERLSEIK